VDSDGARSAGAGKALSQATAGTVSGTVTETLPSAMYRVRLDDGPFVLTHIADRTDRNFVRVLIGDRVRVELSRVDAGRGRIVGKM
jgi:translation initiation factor IF-1